MIGSGGKIGGPPPDVGRLQTPSEPAAKAPAQPKTQSGPKGPSDQFERGATAARSGGAGPAPQMLGRESTNSASLLRMARENPDGARELVARFAQQASNALTEAQREMAAARGLLEKMAGERFSKKARAEHGKALRAQREKLAAIKLRHQLAARKMALLQQLAGKLGDPRLEEELDRILSRHSKLKSGWGKRHDLLSMGSSLYGDLPETPEHLKRVIRADVHAGGRGEEVGAQLEELSPRRIFSELMARTLDGSRGKSLAPDPAASRGELGRALQTYGQLVDAIADELDDNPFDNAS